MQFQTRFLWIQSILPILKKNFAYTVFFLAHIFFRSLSAMMEPSIETGSAVMSERLEFSEQVGEYFSDEIALPSSPKSAEKPDVKLKSHVKVSAVNLQNGRWRLIFIFPSPIIFIRKDESDELFIEFNQGVDSPDLVKAQEKLGFLVKKFSTGFNKVHIIPKKPVFYHTEASENTFTLDIIPDDQAPIKETRALKIANARLFIEMRCYQAARCALFQLMEEYPNDKDIIVLYATLEGLIPRWQRQYRILYGLSSEYPLDADIRTLMYEAYSPHSSYILSERQLQRTIGLAAVQVYRLQGEEIISMTPDYTLYAGAQFQLYRGHVGLIVNNQGNPEGFRGTRCQGNLYVRKEWVVGGHLTGVLYDQEGAVGALGEAGLLFPSIQSEFNLITYWHRPYWAIFEALAFNGREDMVKLQFSTVYSRYLSLQLETGAHRVGITGTPNGFKAIMASGQLFINLLVGNPIIAFNYALDADYVTWEKVKIGVSGNKYNPVPYVSFENHTVRGYLFYKWREHWYITLFGGETFNRLGLNDRTYGVSVKYSRPLPCGWELELSAYRFPSTTVQGATSEYYTGTFTGRF